MCGFNLTKVSSAMLLQEMRALVGVLWYCYFWAVKDFLFRFDDSSGITPKNWVVQKCWGSFDHIFIPVGLKCLWLQITVNAEGRLRGSFKSCHLINVKLGSHLNVSLVSTITIHTSFHLQTQQIFSYVSSFAVNMCDAFNAYCFIQNFVFLM